MSKATITEADRLEGGVIRIWMKVKGQTFRRLYEPGCPPVWMAGSYSVEPKQQKELEAIFRATPPEGSHKEIVNALPPPPPVKKPEPAIDRRPPSYTYVKTTTIAPKSVPRPKPETEKEREVPTKHLPDKEEIAARDIKIIGYLASGYDHAETGALVDLDKRTVEGRVLVIRQNYKAANVMHMVATALRKNLIPPIRSAKSIVVTDREKEIIRYVSNGFTAKEIAGKIGISERQTVKIVSDLRKHFEALNVSNLVAIAISNKIIQ